MAIKVSEIDRQTLIEISGELDNQAIQQARDLITPLVKPDCQLVLDLHQLKDLSGLGLRWLRSLQRQVAPHGQMVLVGLRTEIVDSMATSGLLDAFVVVKSREEAQLYLNSRPPK